MGTETPERPDVSKLLERDYSPLLAGVGCVSSLVILGGFVAGISLMLYSLFKLHSPDESSSSTMLWRGGICLFGSLLLIWLIERIVKLAGFSPQEFVIMTQTPFIVAMNNLVNWRFRITGKRSDNQNVISARELYAQMKVKARTRYVQANENEDLPAQETDKEE